MGLSLAVGSTEGESAVTSSLSKSLVEAGLRAHVEPRLAQSETLHLDLFGFSGLHYVRRVAAHIALGKPLTEPGDEDASEDPVVAEYYARVVPAPGGLLRRLFTRKRAPERLSFQHLMVHSDAEGYYVPQDFPDVIHPRAALKVPGGIVGSSQRLLAEATEIVAWLELPQDLDAESEALWDAADAPPDQGPKWQRFGRESFCALRLLRAAEHSVRSGAAIILC